MGAVQRPLFGERKEPPEMQIFLHTPTGLALVEDVDDSTTVAVLIERSGLAEAIAWLKGADDPLDLSDLVADTVGDKGHVHVNRCHRVVVERQLRGQAENPHECRTRDDQSEPYRHWGCRAGWIRSAG